MSEFGGLWTHWKKTACSVCWVARLCRSWLSLWKETRISRGKNPIGTIHIRHQSSNIFLWQAISNNPRVVNFPESGDVRAVHYSCTKFPKSQPIRLWFTDTVSSRQSIIVGKLLYISSNLTPITMTLLLHITGDWLKNYGGNLTNSKECCRTRQPNHRSDNQILLIDTACYVGTGMFYAHSEHVSRLDGAGDSCQFFCGFDVILSFSPRLSSSRLLNPNCLVCFAAAKVIKSFMLSCILFHENVTLESKR